MGATSPPTRRTCRGCRLDLRRAMLAVTVFRATVMTVYPLKAWRFGYAALAS